MSCDRFEREGLALLEQGRELPGHMKTCADCVAASEAHQRLQDRLAAAGAELEPPVGWETRVRARALAEARPAVAPAGWRAAALAMAGALVIAIGGLGTYVYKQHQKQQQMEAENRVLQMNIDDAMKKISANATETQTLLTQLASEHEEAKRKELQAQLDGKAMEREAEEARLEALKNSQGHAAHKAGGSGASDTAAKGVVRKNCDPNDPMCGI